MPSIHSISLSDEVAAKLAELARTTNHSEDELIKKALLQYMEDIEDYQAGVAAWEEFEKSGEAPVSAQKLKARLGLDD